MGKLEIVSAELNDIQQLIHMYVVEQLAKQRDMTKTKRNEYDFYENILYICYDAFFPQMEDEFQTRKDLENHLKKSIDSINEFFGSDLIRYRIGQNRQITSCFAFDVYINPKADKAALEYAAGLLRMKGK